MDPHSLFATPRDLRRGTPVSLTPLIDVVFILLVFFMLATSLVDWRTIELNAPTGPGAGSSMEGALVVEVRREGIRVAGETIPPGSLVARVNAYLTRKPDGRVLVKPGPGVTLQGAVRVLDRLAIAGVKELALIRRAGR